MRLRIRVGLVLLGSILAATSFVSVAPAHADPDTGGAEQEFTGSLADVRKQLDELEDQQADLAAQKLAVQERLTATENQLAATQAQINAEKAAMAQLETQLGNIALQQYQDRGLNTTARIMASPSADDLLGYITVMQLVTDTANSLVTSLQLEQGALLELERSEQAAVAVVAKERKQLETLEKQARDKVAKATQLLNQMTAAAAAKTSGGGSNDAVRFGVADPAKTVPEPSTKMVTPLRKYTVTDAYGMRNNPFTGAYSFHDALDMAAPCGTSIVSPANGFVIDYYWASGYGNRMIVDHGLIDGHHVVTSFNHLSAGVAKPSSSVVQGQVIALVGTTGASTGCHLHYMVWIDGKTVNPADYV